MIQPPPTLPVKAGWAVSGCLHSLLQMKTVTTLWSPADPKPRRPVVPVHILSSLFEEGSRDGTPCFHSGGEAYPSPFPGGCFCTEGLMPGPPSSQGHVCLLGRQDLRLHFCRNRAGRKGGVHPSEQNHWYFQSQGCLVGPTCWRVNSRLLPGESAERTHTALTDNFTSESLHREAQYRVPVAVCVCVESGREEARG